MLPQHALFLEGDPDRIEKRLNRLLSTTGTRIKLITFQPIKVDPTTDTMKDISLSPNRYAVIVIYE